MNSEGAPRLLVVAEPRLFADALARVLRAEYDVSIAAPDAATPDDAGSSHYDAAVLTADARLPARTSVDRVLVLPSDHSGTGIGVLRTRAGERPVAVGGLAAVADALRHGLESSAVGE